MQTIKNSKKKPPEKFIPKLPKNFGMLGFKMENDPHYQIGYDRGYSRAVVEIFIAQSLFLVQGSRR